MYFKFTFFIRNCIFCYNSFVFEQFSKFRKCNFSITIPVGCKWNDMIMNMICYIVHNLNEITLLNWRISCHLFPVKFPHQSLCLDHVHISQLFQFSNCDVATGILVNSLSDQMSINFHSISSSLTFNSFFIFILIFLELLGLILDQRDIKPLISRVGLIFLEFLCLTIKFLVYFSFRIISLKHEYV